jgi:hypothetical protein
MNTERNRAKILAQFLRAAVEEIDDTAGAGALASIAAVAEELEQLADPAPRDERSKFVRVSNELLPMLSKDWSKPLQLRVVEERGGVLVFIARELAPDPAGGARG